MEDRAQGVLQAKKDLKFQDFAYIGPLEGEFICNLRNSSCSDSRHRYSGHSKALLTNLQPLLLIV